MATQKAKCLTESTRKGVMEKEDMKRYLDMTDAELREEIKKSYRVLVKKFHPDAHPPERREWATKIMQKINRVYDMVRQ